VTVLQLHNATMTLVNGAGQSPDYDRPAVVGAVKFTGAQRVFWSEVEERVTAGAGSDIIVRRSVLVDPARAVTWAHGDRVTVLRDGAGTPSVGTVRRLVTSGTAATGRVIRLVLEDA
jgi:hypothetical protein